jgi:cation:H+ antiporter
MLWVFRLSGGQGPGERSSKSRRSPSVPFGLAALSVPILGLIFAASAMAVWFAGSRLAGYVAAVAEKTGLGQAFMGMLLLGGITSLPELAAVSTSAAMGNASLAINNLLGTASINLVLLALADIYFGRGALTAVAARPSTLMQGVLSMLLATIVAMVATVGDVALFGFGAGAGVVALAAIAALWLSSQFEHRHVWAVIGDGEDDNEEADAGEDERSTGRLSLYIAACALLILAAGFLLSSSADAIASKTGLSAGLVGFVLVGLATSLPELSSIVGALRLRRYQMAIGDIFGTNIFNILLIFVADAIYQGKPVLGEVGKFEVIGAILAVLMTGIFIIGLLERKDRTILRMGYDSAAALLTFAAGLWLLSLNLG